ncbi:methyltransferase domain-containing protein [Flavobacterium tyrosinilyticum]|uniref:methyltransferase domain-containing protein n=1 Tax=Flavobacterium tyrosinilyticum TaxID=1658740 RepID=UPI00202E65C9|nr:methyltransferase domain-containing protein [Flavobacterium tyrosinilyticum]MCM0668870.1 methyltransferase domain-containing protein [Flavobacterium tyrosinilyticum]
MGVNTKYRTEETEIMDDFSLQSEELIGALDQIASINQLLGGNKLTLHGIKELLKKTDTSQTITIADIGCGNGDMLRMLAKYGKKRNLKFKLIGIDANAFTIDYAKNLSKDFPNIEYSCMDIFTEDFNQLRYDIVLCTLTLHHFTTNQIAELIHILNQNASIGIVVNDLHRSKIAYRLFELTSVVFNLNTMSRNDGLISILKGFKKNELEDFSKKLNLKNYSINWKWAFRYQWIITKI